MASILRSSKFVRYFAGFTRNVVLNTTKDANGTLLQHSKCLCGNLSNGFTTAVPASNQSLDNSIKRLDNEVRRTGRISKRDIEEILQDIRLQKFATSSQSLLIIRCCGNLVPEELPETRTAMVKEIWKTFNKLNVAMDISHYNALLRVYLENEHPFSPTEFLADLESKGIEPNRVTYQRLISRYCQDGDIEGATRILEFMREKQLPVNENVFNTLIMGHSQADDMKSAADILTVMKQGGLEPSVDTYTTLLCGYARRGEINVIIETLQSCEKKDIYLMDKDILAIIYALAVNGHAIHVDSLLDKIRKIAGYNQDAINTILRLINKGQEETAMKLLKTMSRTVKLDGSMADTGNFIIRQLINANRPVETIIKVCEELQAGNANSTTILIALEKALKNGSTEIAFPLMREMFKKDLPIRQHYFWPLLCADKSHGNISQVFAAMQEFNISPTHETLRQYVIPHMANQNYKSIIKNLLSYGAAIPSVFSSCALMALSTNDLKGAAEIASSSNAFFLPTTFQRPLAQALQKTEDYDSFIVIVRKLHDCVPRLQSFRQKDDDDSVQNMSQAEFLGSIVLDVTTAFKTNSVSALEIILPKLIDEGLSISNNYAERIREKLGSELTTEISDSLAKLASGDLEPTFMDKRSGIDRVVQESNSRLKINQLIPLKSVEELERLIAVQEEKGMNGNSLKRQLIISSLKTNDVEKITQIIAKLEAEDYNVGLGVYAIVMDMHSMNNNIDEALQLLNKIRMKDPDFQINVNKIVKLASAFVNNDRIDEAIQFLEENKKKDGNMEDKTLQNNVEGWRLLTPLAEKGKVEELNKMFTSLIEMEYITPVNNVLSALVKVHLVNNDMESAIKAFEEICHKYRTTPMKRELTSRLIQLEDAENLQRVTDVSTEIHGEVNSLYDLVFSFIECGRIKQAKKILETPGLTRRHKRITSICEFYHQEGMTVNLEGLIEATKDTGYIDRSEIYYYLLLNYIKEKNPEKALGLWTAMQEENIHPSDLFLIKLANLLKNNQLAVPFIVPAIGKTNRIDGVIGKTKEKPVNDTSLKIEKLLETDDNDEATKEIFKALEEKKNKLSSQTLKKYLNNIAAAGDYETFFKISDYITEDDKRKVTFNALHYKAYESAGKAEELMKLQEEMADKLKKDENVQNFCKSGGGYNLLQSHPELCDRFEANALKHVACNNKLPMNLLWMYHFMHGNDEAADRIWNKHLINERSLTIRRIVNTARNTNNDKLLHKLSEKIKNTEIAEIVKVSVYNALIGVHLDKKDHNAALSALEMGLTGIPLKDFSRNVLVKLKEQLESSGKSFAYEIPAKNQKVQESSSSSSSSSSDDEEEVKGVMQGAK